MPIDLEWCEIERRPFAIEPVTGIMLPDGFFDSAVEQQCLACHLTNITNASLIHLNVRIKSVSDPNFVVAWQTHDVQQYVVGSSRLLTWNAISPTHHLANTPLNSKLYRGLPYSICRPTNRRLSSKRFSSPARPTIRPKKPTFARFQRGNCAGDSRKRFCPDLCGIGAT
jgi:hypothetical protein